MESFVGENFLQLMKSGLKNSENKENVREHIKKIWMYPQYKYAEWINLDIDANVLSEIHDDLSKIKFVFRIVNGKVYLCPITGSFSNLIYDRVRNFLENNIVPNVEASHVTVINSNIVYDIGIDRVTEFVDKYQDEFELGFGKIKSTISNDWSVFSKCYVIEIQSNYLAQFITDFNNQFGKSIRPSTHVTFAIRVRNCIPDTNM